MNDITLVINYLNSAFIYKEAKYNKLMINFSTFINEECNIGRNNNSLYQYLYINKRKIYIS